MVSTSKSSKQQQRAISRSLGYDFALLGLSARESRVEVIREAAANTAVRIQEAATEETERDSMLSDLATSTYRLLDPRRRNRTFERIQLSLFGESDLERQQQARTPLLAPRLVAAEIADDNLDEDQQLREAKQEIVQILLESSRTRRRVGTVTGSLLTTLVLTIVSLTFFLTA